MKGGGKQITTKRKKRRQGSLELTEKLHPTQKELRNALTKWLH